MVGRRLLHYEITGKLGEGGMGVVYKAHDSHLDRPVALKVLPPDKLADPERQRRFVQEAKAASALDHPNIIHVYDIDTVEGISFIAMEYVEGKTLDQLIPRSGLRLNDLLKYAIQIASGLARAHAAGIVHRDLKPGNLMVSADGRVRILDFGLAKLTETLPAAADFPTRTMQAATEEGSILGTVAYMSPEQAEGRNLDARSDIFSFGSVLYEMATGRRAFQGDSAIATLSLILQQEPQLAQGIPADLEKLIARCLRKDPARRIQHMDDVRLALEDLKEESDSGRLSPPPTRSPRRGVALAAAWLGALVLLATGTWFLLGRRNRPPEVPSATMPLTSYPGNEAQPCFSPDGNQVAFVWDGERQDNPDIYVKLIGAEKPLRLTTEPEADISPAWSPDGRFIAFVRNPLSADRKAAVFTVPAIGGPEKLIVELGTRLAFSAEGARYAAIAPFPLVAWAEGGKSLLFVDRTAPGQPLEIFLISLDSGERRRILSPPPGALGDGALSVSPDGRTLLFSRALSMSSSDLYRLPLTSDLRPAGPPERLTTSKEWNSTAVWMSASDIIFSAGGKFNGPFHLWRMTVQSGAEPHRLASYEDGSWPAYSPGRARFVFSRAATDSNIWRVPLPDPIHAGVPARLISSTREEGVPQYSPDGSKIVFTSNRSGNHEVWVCAKDGSNAVQLTSLRAGMTGSPHWSPDGNQIVFDSNVEGQFEIYTINSAGGAPRRLTSDPSDDAIASYSRDGRSLYFSSNRTKAWQVWKMPAAGGPPVQVTRQGGRGALESPDARFIFYENILPRSVWKCPANGGPETEVLPSVGFINFTLTAQGIYFIPRNDSDDAATIQFLAYSASAPKSVFTANGPASRGLTVSHDGKFLLYTQIDQSGSDLMLVENFR